MARNSTKYQSLTRCGLALAFITLSPMLMAQTIGSLNQEKKEPVIEPEKQPEVARSAQIDTESFELGVYAGVLNIEDFNSNPVVGLSFLYHINKKFTAQALYGTSKVSKATFEELTDSDFLSDEDRNFQYLELLGGYKLLSGRSFLGSSTKLDSDLYLNAGFGQMSFADSSSVGLVIGGSYRLVVTDWMTMNFDIRDHIFNREFIGDSKVTHNTEFSIGFNALF